MSGHSKWATIKRQKGANDAKRAQLFTKLSKAITIAVKHGGGIGDPSSNFRLRLAIEDAKASNMPKDNIDRAIARASGKDAADLQEALYEGFGPGGFSVIVETLSDNKQRTVSELKNIFDKNGGTLGNPGSVSYQFEKKGMVTVSKDGKSIDDIFLIAAESQAEDVEDAGEEVLVYTKPEDLAKVRNSLIDQGVNVKTAEVFWRPIVINTISDKDKATGALDFIEKIEAFDDVHKVYANFDIPDQIIENR